LRRHQMLRVIGGTARGRKLKTVPGEGTRPALSVVRAAVFNIARGLVPGSRFLDLFAGTGSYAIEALSRGAAEATLVELNPRAVAVIRSNLENCGFAEAARLIQGDVLQVVERLRDEGRVFDIIMVAPPYFQGLAPRVMEKIAALGLLQEGGICFVQHHVKEEIPPRFPPLALAKRYKYGSTELSLFGHTD